MLIGKAPFRLWGLRRSAHGRYGSLNLEVVDLSGIAPAGSKAGRRHFVESENAADRPSQRLHWVECGRQLRSDKRTFSPLPGSRLWERPRWGEADISLPHFPTRKRRRSCDRRRLRVFLMLRPQSPPGGGAASRRSGQSRQSSAPTWPAWERGLTAHDDLWRCHWRSWANWRFVEA